MVQLTSRLGSILDRAAIERLVATCGDGGTEVVASLLGTFFDDAPRVLAGLHRAIERNHTEDARRAAHTLKGNGMTFGALFLAHVAREIETLAIAGDIEGAATLFGELEAEFRMAREALQELRRELLDERWCPVAA